MPARVGIARVSLDLREGLAGAPAILTRHWLLVFNLLVTAVALGVFVTPALMALGLDGPAAAPYALYHPACHQWAFRSFFLFGPQATYTRDQLVGLGVDPFRVVGGPELGWKMAFCERNLAIVVGLLVFGLLYTARWPRAELRPLGWIAYGLLIAPMALDGFTQLGGWRESTWEVRMLTGGLFGAASAWFLYTRLPAPERRNRRCNTGIGRGLRLGEADIGTPSL